MRSQQVQLTEIDAAPPERGVSKRVPAGERAVSVDALAMLLLGGVQTVIGPLVGAGLLHVIEDQAMPLTDYWRLILGIVLIAIVLLGIPFKGSFLALTAGAVSNRLNSTGEERTRSRCICDW